MTLTYSHIQPKHHTKKYRKPFGIAYYYWGHTTRQMPDKWGSAEELQEAYANAARHLGRGSVYYKAIIIDRENMKIVSVLTRRMGMIHIEEK